MTTLIHLSAIEKHLSEQGNFCLLDWLIESNALPYSHYEAWRYGKHASITEALELDADTLQQLFITAEKYCTELKLHAEPQAYFRWGDQQQRQLQASKDKDVHQAITQSWLRSQDLPQLDLFMDNSAVIAENALRTALAARQFDHAQQKLQQLTQLNPKHARLGGYQDLINYGQHIVATPSIDEEARLPELLGLQQEVQALAKEMLGSVSRDYLAFAWRRLGQNLDNVEFNPQHPELHSSYVYAQIPDWEKVTTSLINAKQLYPEPLLMTRLAHSFENQQQSPQALIIWCLLVEQHSDYAEKAIESKTSKRIYDLWEDFWEAAEEGPRTYFPAFVLARQPGLIHLLDEFPPLVHPASAAMIELLKARIDGDSEVAGREKLQTINPLLLHLYMNIRAT